MKDLNKIIIIISVFVISLIVGYALFSEKININGTANASGKMEFEISNVSADEATYDYEDLNIVTNGNTLTVSVKLLEPGALLTLSGVLKNIGTVDARLTDITTNKESNFNFCSNYNICSSDSEELMGYKDEETGIAMISAIGDESGALINSNNIILKAGNSSNNSVPIVVFIYWDEAWNKPITEPKEITFSTTFNFVQAQ